MRQRIGLRGVGDRHLVFALELPVGDRLNAHGWRYSRETRQDSQRGWVSVAIDERSRGGTFRGQTGARATASATRDCSRAAPPVGRGCLFGAHAVYYDISIGTGIH